MVLNVLKIKYLVFALICFAFRINAQVDQQVRFGFQCAAIFDIGSHVRQVGVKCAFYTNYKHVQLNLGTRLTYNSLSYGNRIGGLDSRYYFGVIGLWGIQNRILDFELDELNHQTKYANSIGFSSIWYNDQFGTTQRSGAIMLGRDLVQLKFENDLFAAQGRDRFRTGAFGVSYLQDQLKYHLTVLMWTGETRGSVWTKASTPLMPNGFRDLSLLPYGQTSHGIISGGICGKLDYGQSIGVKIGMDSEQFRHIIQNKLMHDLVFLPKFIERKTPHYPRIGENGTPVFESDSRRKDQFFMQAGFGQAWSY
jgi:hypothetical protein